MEINTANVSAVGSAGSTSNSKTNNTPAKQAGRSAFSSRLVSRISSSSTLSGTEKTNLIETVALIDNLKSANSIRSKLLKDVSAATSFLETNANKSTRQPIKVQQQVEIEPKQIEAISQRITREIEIQQPSEEAIALSASDKLNEVVSRANARNNSTPNDVINISAANAREPINNQEQTTVEVVNIEIAELELPGSNPQPREAISRQNDNNDNDTIEEEQPVQELKLPGSGEFVFETNIRQVNTSEFANNAANAKIIDTLV